MSSELLMRVTNNHSALISVEQLESLLGGTSVKVFDVRGTWSGVPRALPEEYDAEHIPGAVFLDWTEHFVEQEMALGLAAVADKAGAEESFRSLGIDKDDFVVLYDDYHHMLAGRIWWAMRYWGFVNIRVLNGGWRYWSSQNLPVSSVAPQVSSGTFKPQMQERLLIGIDPFLTARHQSCVIDARGPENFAGKADDPRTGHIPKSLNLPFRSVLNADTGLFIKPEAIAELFDNEIPQWRDTPIIASCGSGYAATVILLALFELERTATLFDGSFAVWKQDPDRPVEQSAPG